MISQPDLRRVFESLRDYPVVIELFIIGAELGYKFVLRLAG